MIPAKFLKSIEGTTNLYEIRVEHNGKHLPNLLLL
jgi:hypothetical protein